LRLRSFRAVDWRNLSRVELEPGPRVTVFSGDNGQGKTNLLEAAHFLFTLRSFRAGKAIELVRWGAARAELGAEAEAHGLVRRLQVKVAEGLKILSVDGKVVRRDAPALAGLGAVLFLPEDLLLPRAAPSARRAFIDRAAFAVDRVYGAEAIAFERVLRSRNVLLKRGGAEAALLDTYDEELARTGARVVMRRRALAAALAPRLERLFAALHADLQARMAYRSHASVDEAAAEEDVRTALLAGLRATREGDLRRGFTGFGPHTDDLALSLLGRRAAEHASQGQLRSFVLALKLAELENLEDRLGEPPLLLLDDVSSELDETRRRQLYEALARLSGQTFITATDRRLLPELEGRVDFVVRAGELGRFDPDPTVVG
jgi:DNA replication and repair protein RecF